MATFNITKRAFARERLNITSGAPVSLTASLYDDVSDSNNPTTLRQGSAVPRKASGARIVLESGTGDIHFSEEGTAPTSGTTNTDVGTIAGARDVIVLESYEAITKWKAIALSTTAVAEVVYYR